MTPSSDPGDPVASTYTRRIVVSPGPTAIDAEMEDHHHHFRVHLDLVDGVISGVSTTAVRSPWSTCATGATAIASLVGLSLDDAFEPRTWGADRSVHCTHVADLALLAVRHGRDVEALRYDVRVVPAAAESRTAVLEHRGAGGMRWELSGQVITGPQPFDRLSLGRDQFLPWIRSSLAPAQIEYAMVLRRAATIAVGNAFDLDDYATAGDVHPADQTCHTYRREIAFTARRKRGTSRALSWSDPGAP